MVRAFARCPTLVCDYDHMECKVAPRDDFADPNHRIAENCRIKRRENTAERVVRQKLRRVPTDRHGEEIWDAKGSVRMGATTWRSGFQ